MNGYCDVCKIDLVQKRAEREAVPIEYPLQRGNIPTQRLNLDLYAEHLAMAEDPGNAVKILKGLTP